MQNTISSKKAAHVLNVNESTIKRWADNNILKCVKTAGGHRKFILEDIRNYALSHELNTPLIIQDKIRTRVRQFIQKRNYSELGKVLEKFLLNEEIDNSYNFLYTLYLNNYKPEEIFDSIVRNTMQSIGHQWKRGTLGIENEHIASNTLISALYQLEKSISPGKLNGMTAMCTGLENEEHGIGLLCVKITLQQLGYKVFYPGINLPMKSLINLNSKYNPSIVCISTSLDKNDKEFVKELNMLKKQSEQKGFTIFIGGLNMEKSADEDESFYTGSLKELVMKLKSSKK